MKTLILSTLIFSYGSLITEESAAKTLSPEALATRRPATASGIRRLFNRDIPEKLIVARYGALEKPHHRAALNVYHTGNPNDRVNGVVLDVCDEELQALRAREVGYELIPVVVMQGEEQLVAYTFSAPDQFTSSEIEPVPGYYEDVRAGAASYGPAFLDLYLQTTYLADGTTLIEE